MKLTREEALKYHRMMWTDMQTELGDNADPHERRDFKEKWCGEHFPAESIISDCFLCEYDEGRKVKGETDCKYCPIQWPEDGFGYPDCCARLGCDPYNNELYFLAAPISEILALPEREV